MKLTKSILATGALASLFLACQASAITWIDRDPDSGSAPDYIYDSNDRGASHSGNFNIAEKGFDSAIHMITSIKVEFAFADDSDDWRDDNDNSGSRDRPEYIDAFLGNPYDGFTQIFDDVQVDGSHYNAPHNYHVISTFVALSNVVLADLSNGIILYDVYVDGKVDGREDTYLKWSRITVEGTEIVQQQVADNGTTLTLLGLGVIGLAAVRRLKK